jgi:hypothetical protein
MDPPIIWDDEIIGKSWGNHGESMGMPLGRRKSLKYTAGLSPVIMLVIFLQGLQARLPGGKAAGQGCRARLPGKAAGQGCRARLPGKAAMQGLWARLPGKASGQGCQARVQGCIYATCRKLTKFKRSKISGSTLM